MEHHTVETCIVVRRISISGIFLEEMDGVCYRPKKKRTIQPVTSNKSESQGLSWYGVVSVPLAKVTYTSVMAPLMPKSTEILEQHMLPSRRVLDWPACSPDSPIENVWRILKCKMRQRSPRTVAHLKTCLQEEWDKVTPETLTQITWCLQSLFFKNMLQ